MGALFASDNSAQRSSLYGRMVFGESQLKPYVGIHVAVGHMVHDLANGPSSIAVRSIQLLIGEAGDSGAHERGRMFNAVEVLLFLLRGERSGVGEFSNRKARISHGSVMNVISGTVQKISCELRATSSSATKRNLLECLGSSTVLVVRQSAQKFIDQQLVLTHHGEETDRRFG